MMWTAPKHLPQEQELTAHYAKLYRHQILSEEWIHTKPAVPFVGSEYNAEERARVLVYGSAENLNFAFDQSSMTFSRNRTHFERWKTGELVNEEWSKDNWFPWVHMTPITDGTLLTATRYLLDVFGITGFSTSPEDFLHQIAVGNYGKFSLKAERNQDYASDATRLDVSFAYVKADLEVLRPDIVILPRTIYRYAFANLLKTSNHKPQRTWTIYQTNASVINRHVKTQLDGAGIETERQRPAWTREWIKHIKGVRMDRYLDWIDWRAGRIKGSKEPDWPIELLVD